MTKEYTGQEFEIEFARAWLAYVEGGKVGVDPRNDWEFSDMFKDWSGKSGFPLCNSKSYRWKPAPKRTVKISYQDNFGVDHQQELVAPETEAPKLGTTYFVINDLEVSRFNWVGNKTEDKWLEAGLVFLTGEDAAAMSEWLAVCRRGGAT